MTWNNQPAKTGSPNDVPNSSSALPNTNTTASLAHAAIPSTAGEFIVTLNLSVFTNWLATDSNQKITFVLANDSATIVKFASLANTGGNLQPTLELVSPVADFSVSVSPTTQTVASGTNANFTVSLTASNGFSAAAALSVDGLPSGVTADFSSNSISGSGSAMLTFQVAPEAEPGTYLIPVTAVSGALLHSTNLTLTIFYADSDGDGVPDWWTQKFFNHADGQAADQSRADDDADGDGMSNLAEYVSGTDPMDSTSYLHMLNVETQGDDKFISWSAIGGVSYVLQIATNLPDGFFDLSPVITLDQDGTASFTDVGAATNSPERFYRVRVVP